MITYFYWIATIILTFILSGAIVRFLSWKLGVLVGFLMLTLSWFAYHFKYEQLFVKNYGGTMSIEVPKGQMHISATWKDDHLWIENFEPATNTCYFNEYSKGHMLQGRVAIENCNPLLPTLQTGAPSHSQ